MTTSHALPTKEQHAKDYLRDVEKLLNAWYLPGMPPIEDQHALTAAKRLLAEGQFTAAIHAGADIVKGLV